jgi:hypothetical protein
MGEAGGKPSGDRIAGHPDDRDRLGQLGNGMNDDGTGRHKHVWVLGDRDGGEARQPRRVATGIAVIDDDVVALAIAMILEPGRDPLKRFAIAALQYDDMRHALLRGSETSRNERSGGERRDEIAPAHGASAAAVP